MSAGENLQKKQDQRQHNSEPPCNVCGEDRVIEYLDKDEETGKQVKRTHTVGCIGHPGVMPVLLNKTEEYKSYQKWLEKHQTACCQPRHR